MTGFSLLIVALAASLSSRQPDARSSVRFRVGERLVGWLLVRMAAIANRRGDLHETRHIIAQLTVGESVDCGLDCPLRPRPLDGEHAGSPPTESPAEPTGEAHQETNRGGDQA